MHGMSSHRGITKHMIRCRHEELFIGLINRIVETRVYTADTHNQEKMTAANKDNLDNNDGANDADSNECDHS